MEEKKKYSVRLYEDDVYTGQTLEFEEGDEKWQLLMKFHNEIPEMINVWTKDNNLTGQGFEESI